jgi:hypothetical protein
MGPLGASGWYKVSTSFCTKLPTPSCYEVAPHKPSLLGKGRQLHWERGDVSLRSRTGSRLM